MTYSNRDALNTVYVSVVYSAALGIVLTMRQVQMGQKHHCRRMLKKRRNATILCSPRTCNFLLLLEKKKTHKIKKGIGKQTITSSSTVHRCACARIRFLDHLGQKRLISTSDTVYNRFGSFYFYLIPLFPRSTRVIVKPGEKNTIKINNTQL